MTDSLDAAVITLALGDSIPALEFAGGKGRSLAALANAGLPVPAGFIVGTAAYRAVVAANDLGAALLELVDREAPDVASREIAARFQDIPIPSHIAAQILSARQTPHRHVTAGRAFLRHRRGSARCVLCRPARLFSERAL